MSLKAFVTGGTGFVGSNLVRELIRQGWEVTILTRPSSRLDDLRDLPVHVQTGDLGNARSVCNAMPDKPNAVFHVAASTNVWSGNNDDQDRINIGGTRNVIEAAVQKQAGRMIFTGSFTTWGLQDVVISEHTPRSDTTDWINYVRTKHIAENLVRQEVGKGRLDAVILSPAHILGPGDRRNWSRMICMIQQDSLPGIPPGSGPFSDVREVARAHVTAYDKGEKGETYLLGGEHVSFLKLVQIVAEILGKPVPEKPTPAWQLKLGARLKVLIANITGKEPDITPESAVMIIQNIRCDSSRAQHALGYRFTPIRPLLQDTVDWLWKAGMMG
jgi:nucleoside-diphosphate-sugar epimerase